ncbi:MAG: hydroxyacid dehydrogenase [Alphaproteobacteria bacterium]|nr:hydroxyacid dehydrogenase [Alphaproteobacteria bacterium]MCB9927849.1 hydroxyacid dehydrogenase [Alphaproteobacteria bacterium]
MKQPTASAPTLVIAFPADSWRRGLIEEALGTAGHAIYLEDLDEAAGRHALAAATAVFAQRMADLPDDVGDLLAERCRLLQFHSAGVDYLPLQHLPEHLPIAGNGGAFAEPMAEHGLALALAAAKRLFVEHENLKSGAFNQFVRNKMLAGGVAGILGFGGIGVACGRLFRGLGMKVHAIKRSGESDEPVDWIGTPDRLDELLAASDVLVLALPLTQTTERLLTAERLALMRPDAILVNLARGEIVDEAALYAHLRANPAFTACLDAWWVEPVRHGRFAMGYPFLDLPNVIGSPHNSASVGAWRGVAVRRAVENCVRALKGETPRHLVRPEERML